MALAPARAQEIPPLSPCAADSIDPRMMLLAAGHASGFVRSYWDAGKDPAYGRITLKTKALAVRSYETRRNLLRLAGEPGPGMVLESLVPALEQMSELAQSFPPTEAMRAEFARAERLNSSRIAALSQDLEWYWNTGYTLGRIHAFANLEDASALTVPAQGLALTFHLRTGPADMLPAVREALTGLQRELKPPNGKLDLQQISRVATSSNTPPSCRK